MKNNQTVINKNKKDEETNIPDIPDSKSSRLSTRLKTNSDDYKQYIIISSKNKELKLQIKEKNEKIKELTETQQRDKKSLIELLKKVRKAIEENENVLFPEKSNIDEDKNNNNREKLLEKLEKIKKENNKIKEINKEKYGIMKKYNINLNTSPIEEFDNLNTRINALKENNSFLNKEIVLLNHKNNIDKVRSLNPKYKILDVKNFSDKYISLTKEKYKQKTLLKNNKKIINEMVQKFKDLMQKINEEKEEIKNSELNREINILKKDLSGDEENIYNKIISDKSIILSNYYKNNIKLNNSTNNLKIMLTARTQKIRLEKKIKGLFHNKSSQDINNIQNYRKKKIKYISIDNKNINSISYDYDNIDYNLMSNVDFKNLSSKKEKYLNLTEKLDKTINDLTTFYENRTKEINILLDMNSKKLSNIHQENELLTSEIADMKRVLELNNITHKLMNVNNRTNFNNVYEESIRKLNILKVKEKNISQINTNNFDNDRESYIEKIKKKYKNKIKIFHKESLLNNRTYI